MLVDGRTLEKYLKSFRGDITNLDVIVGEQGKKCYLVAMRAAPESTTTRHAERERKHAEAIKSHVRKVSIGTTGISY